LKTEAVEELVQRAAWDYREALARASVGRAVPIECRL
jgi:hypothetical protein